MTSQTLKFYENATLYIQDVAVTNAYMYLDTRNMAGNNFWTFALNFPYADYSEPKL